MQKMTHQEKDLYASIEDRLKKRGFKVWPQATVRAGDTGTKTADHVGWKWEGDRIEALAVEVKKGDADTAIAQAVAYQVGFRHVYIAAETALAEMGYLARVIAHLGLGYIRIDGHGTGAEIEREARDSLFMSERPHDENIARIRANHLLTDEVVGGRVRVGRDRRGGILGCQRNDARMAALHTNRPRKRRYAVMPKRGVGRA